MLTRHSSRSVIVSVIDDAPGLGRGGPARPGSWVVTGLQFSDVAPRDIRQNLQHPPKAFLGSDIKILVAGVVSR